jgi:hypothetical protein
MALLDYRGNLSATSFPFLSELGSRSVIVPGQDQNFNRQVYPANAGVDNDIGIPQAFYMHNVLPMGFGYQSVGYELRVPNPLGPGVVFSSVSLLRNTAGAGVDISPGMQAGVNGIWVLGSTYDPTHWVFVNHYWDGSGDILWGIDLTNTLTTAHVSGVTYIYVANHGLFQWNFAAQRFETVAVTGINIFAVIGIAESNGYLIAYTPEAIAWSSTLDPTDFVLSLATGAGGGKVENAKGPITGVSSTNTGIIIWTNLNAVAGTYTGNPRTPYAFIECTGAGGLESIEQFTYDNNSGNNYAWTTYGLQTVSARQADTIMADLTDYISGQVLEDFDITTGLFSTQHIAGKFLVKLVLISSRYLAISYGISSYTHIMVYDTELKRWGRLKIGHVDCFEYYDFGVSVGANPKKSIGILTQDGNTYTVDFDLRANWEDSVLILGKFQ